MLNKNTLAPEFTTVDIYGNKIKLSEYIGKKVMLSFYRYASCIFCNLRIAELIKLYPKVKNNIEFIAVFQSPANTILEYSGKQKPPFAIISDPEWNIYNLYKVSKGSLKGYILGLLNIKRILKSFASGFRLGKKDGYAKAIPADFLIDENGILNTVYYGKDISDHLDTEKIISFAENTK